MDCWNDEELKMDLTNRTDLHITCTVAHPSHYPDVVNALELKYPGFKVLEAEYNPRRERIDNGYAFYMKREV